MMVERKRGHNLFVKSSIPNLNATKTVKERDGTRRGNAEKREREREREKKATERRTKNCFSFFSPSREFPDLFFFISLSL